MTGFAEDGFRLRPWDAGDVEDVARFHDLYRRAEVARWLGGGAGVPCADEAEAARRIGRWAQLEDPPYGLWALVPDGAPPAGTVLLLPVPDGGGEVEIGWHLHPDSQGRGWATRGGRAVAERAFAAGLPTVVALVAPGNTASSRVCRRLGMVSEGVTDRYYGMRLEVFRLSRGARAG